MDGAHQCKYRTQAETLSQTFFGANISCPSPDDKAGSLTPSSTTTSACTDDNNTEVTDWLGIKIRKINVGVRSPGLGAKHPI